MSADTSAHASAASAAGAASAGTRGNASVFASTEEGPWLFGRSTDLWAFGGSAALSVALLGIGAALGVLHADAPTWVWVSCILLVDVAHVWSTIFRVYLDPVELRRRPLLYLGLPLLCYGVGLMAYALHTLAFWRVLAYVALFHFVRQQYGWVSLYRRRARESGQLDRSLDTLAIYSATLYPVIHWHAHLPRRFHWFVPGDFVPGLAAPLASALQPLYWGVLLAFCARQLQLRLTGRSPNVGKVLVVLSTFLCWHLGIVAFDSDYAFTVTNVLIHGLPYMVLTYRHGRMRAAAGDAGRPLALSLRGGVLGFVLVVALLAFTEEALWDRLVWHDHEWLFGQSTGLEPTWLVFLVPLLALPQAVHYALDGFIWRVRPENPTLQRELAR